MITNVFHHVHFAEEPMDTSENGEPEPSVIQMPAVKRKSTTSGEESEEPLVS